MLCGDPLALSVMVTAAESGPVVAGAKWPWIEQLAPAARLLPQEFANTNEDASAPVTAMLVIDSGAPPVLVNVTDCDGLAVSTTWFPNERLADVSDNAGAVTPVPLSEMLCGDPLALSVMITVAESGPVVAGVKCP